MTTTPSLHRDATRWAVLAAMGLFSVLVDARPALASSFVRWTMEGARTPPSIPEPRQGIQIQVLRKRGAAWRIVAFQNTNSLPEAPFPTE